MLGACKLLEENLLDSKGVSKGKSLVKNLKNSISAIGWVWCRGWFVWTSTCFCFGETFAGQQQMRSFGTPSTTPAVAWWSFTLQGRTSPRTWVCHCRPWWILTRSISRRPRSRTSCIVLFGNLPTLRLRVVSARLCCLHCSQSFFQTIADGKMILVGCQCVVFFESGSHGVMAQETWQHPLLPRLKIHVARRRILMLVHSLLTLQARPGMNPVAKLEAARNSSTTSLMVPRWAVSWASSNSGEWMHTQSC